MFSDYIFLTTKKPQLEAARIALNTVRVYGNVDQMSNKGLVNADKSASKGQPESRGTCPAERPCRDAARAIGAP